MWYQLACCLFNIEQIGTGIKKAAPKDGFLITAKTD